MKHVDTHRRSPQRNPLTPENIIIETCMDGMQIALASGGCGSALNVVTCGIMLWLIIFYSAMPATCKMSDSPVIMNQELRFSCSILVYSLVKNFDIVKS